MTTPQVVAKATSIQHPQAIDAPDDDHRGDHDQRRSDEDPEQGANAVSHRAVSLRVPAPRRGGGGERPMEPPGGEGRTVAGNAEAGDGARARARGAAR